MTEAMTAQTLHLTPADHDHYLEHGWVLLRGLVPADHIERARTKVIGHEIGDDKLDLSPEAFHAFLIESMHPVVQEAASELFGGKEFNRGGFNENKVRCQQPDAVFYLHPHTDFFHQTIQPDRWDVGVFLFLTTVRPGGGAFYFLDGSHRRYRHKAIADNAEALWVAPQRDMVHDEMTELLAEPGDLLLYHHMVVHSGSPNRTDPQARHALTTQLGALERTAPGGRPLDELSTVEKSNSLRYLAERFGERYRLPSIVDFPDGTLTVGRNVRAHDLVRHGGATYAFIATEDEPSALQVLRTTDFVNWTAQHAVRVTDEPITSLHIDHRSDPQLVVNTASGGTVWTSTDLVEWTPQARRDGAALSRTHYVLGSFGHRDARAWTWFTLDLADPTVVRWVCGASQEELATWDATGIARAFPDGMRAVDASVLPVWEGRHWVLVVDDGSSTWISRSPQGDVYPDELSRFADVRDLRLYERARGYWMVSYVRDGQIRLGTIDWEAGAALHEITTRAELVAALDVIGLHDSDAR